MLCKKKEKKLLASTANLHNACISLHCIYRFCKDFWTNFREWISLVFTFQLSPFQLEFFIQLICRNKIAISGNFTRDFQCPFFVIPVCVCNFSLDELVLIRDFFVRCVAFVVTLFEEFQNEQRKWDEAPLNSVSNWFLFFIWFSFLFLNLWNGTNFQMRTQSTRHTEQLNADTEQNQCEQLPLNVWDWSENSIQRVIVPSPKYGEIFSVGMRALAPNTIFLRRERASEWMESERVSPRWVGKLPASDKQTIKLL